MRSRASRAALLRHRWRAHGFPGPLGHAPEEIVGRLAGMQAESYALAKWSLAQRGAGLTEEAIDRAVAHGAILRTHLLRPTWHFVLPRDLRWIQRLTAPRVRAMTAGRLRELELDSRLLGRCRKIITRALEEEGQLTRGELAERLARSGIAARADRMAHIALDAELECLICSGAPRGKAQTYALLDDRAPPDDRLDGDEALAELARRYFTTRGPATEADFRWWSSLRAADARRAIEAASPALERVEHMGRTYWLAPEGALPEVRRSHPIHLIQILDEFVVSYTKSRDLMLQPGLERFSVFGETGRQHPIVRRGRVIGLWQSRIGRGVLEVGLRVASGLGHADREALRRAAVRHGRFFGLAVELISARRASPGTVRR